MTSEEKQQLQKVAARYEKYGISFFCLLQLLRDAPEGMGFRKALNCIRVALGREFNENEFFSIQEAAELTGETEETIIERVKTNNIDYIIVSSSLKDFFNK